MPLINRRQFIYTVGAAAAGTALTGCASVPFLKPSSAPISWPTQTPAATWQLLNRITYGPRPEERELMAEIGPMAFIEEQLAPESLPDIAWTPALKLRRLESLHVDAPDLFDIEAENVRQELQQATLLRAIYSPRQLYELMVDFWSNHFHIDQTKGNCTWLKTIDDRDVIRTHALGNFYDLLYASAHSPAMLIYLDNQENHAGNPNENYARELLELHTLGVDGGYSQQDVQEVARCLTGWTVKDYFYRGYFTFNEEQHDNEAKHVLNQNIPAHAKEAGGEQVLDMLAQHPATAHFIATKLVRRFVADTPPPQLVNQAAQTFLTTQGDIKAVLKTILLSPQLLSPPNSMKPKLKRPLDYVASALRQLKATTDAGPPLLKYLAEMGQPLFQWPTPDGFPDNAAAWQGTLLTRWRFALALLYNHLPGTTLDLQSLRAAAEASSSTDLLNQFALLLFGQPLPPTVANQLLEHNPNQKTLLAALLGSPTFQWR